MLHDTSYKVLLRKDKATEGGTIPIYIRIIKHRKPGYFSTGERCLEDEWNEQLQRLWVTKPRLSEKDKKILTAEQLKAKQKVYDNVSINNNAKRINAKIDDKLDELQQAERDLRNARVKVSSQKIREAVIDIKGVEINFLDFYHHRMENYVRAGSEYNTYRAYKGTYNLLIEYQDGRPLPFTAVDYDYLERFYLYLVKYEYKPSSIKKHFKWMQAIWRKAKANKHVDNNPFEDFSIKAGPATYKQPLDAQEIITLAGLELEGRLREVRDMFLFAFLHAGIRISDLLKLKWQDVKDNRLQYQMKKNQKRTDFKLHKHGKKILKYYNTGGKPGDYIFSFLENGIDESTDYFERQIQSKTAMVNELLKQIGTVAKIDKKLTTHISRHTFGGIATDLNINAFDLSRALRHSKVQTTDAYTGGLNIKRQDKILDEVYKSFSDL